MIKISNLNESNRSNKHFNKQYAWFDHPKSKKAQLRPKLCQRDSIVLCCNDLVGLNIYPLTHVLIPESGKK
jgi:hypothetical protein